MDSACNFIASYAIEGEFLGKKEHSTPSEMNFPVSRWISENPWFANYQTIPGKFTVTAAMLTGGDSRSPTMRLLCDLRRADFNVDACDLEIKALRHYLEMSERAIKDIARRAEGNQAETLRVELYQEVAA